MSFVDVILFCRRHSDEQGQGLADLSPRRGEEERRAGETPYCSDFDRKSSTTFDMSKDAPPCTGG
ncbi:hypothetical protein LA6_000256 [Marinibacterium anthonyi]|nr:hypothetical protein LA6_000256 [Marinibacterium anthonyi]